MPCCYCGSQLGHIYEQSFEDIRHSVAYKPFRQRMRTIDDHQQSEPGCLCFNGCGSVQDNIRTLKRLGLGHNILRPYRPETIDASISEQSS